VCFPYIQHIYKASQYIKCFSTNKTCDAQKLVSYSRTSHASCFDQVKTVGYERILKTKGQLKILNHFKEFHISMHVSPNQAHSRMLTRSWHRRRFCVMVDASPGFLCQGMFRCRHHKPEFHCQQHAAARV
jgi:hypothetical protein